MSQTKTHKNVVRRGREQCERVYLRERKKIEKVENESVFVRGRMSL